MPEARDQLTAQELQIAQLAAEGLSNREIGQRLFLSHRTISTHLYRAFPKLGITSRAELNAALAPAGDGRVRTYAAGRCRHLTHASASAIAATVADRPDRPRRSSMTDVRNVVLVHGGFVDGSGWRGVYDLLTADGFNVSVVQNQTLSLESDVETTHQVLDQQDGPAILVGHSYGGVVITEAGRHERVAGLVYIAAFAPDAGESVNALIADPPPGRARAADPAARRRVPVPGPGEVRALLRRGPAGGGRGLHGRLAGPVGPRGAQRRGHANRPGAASRAGTWSPPTTA